MGGGVPEPRAYLLTHILDRTVLRITIVYSRNLSRSLYYMLAVGKEQLRMSLVSSYASPHLTLPPRRVMPNEIACVWPCPSYIKDLGTRPVTSGGRRRGSVVGDFSLNPRRGRSTYSKLPTRAGVLRRLLVDS